MLSKKMKKHLITNKRTLLLACIFLLIGYIFAVRIISQTDALLRRELLLQANIVAKALDIDLVKTLTGIESDLELHEYQYLHNQLSNVLVVNERYMYLYLMGRNQDREIFYYLDVQDDDIHEESTDLPGTIYSEATKELIEVFDNAVSFVEGPVTDEWGVWVSAIVPIVDPETNEVIAIFGMDIESGAWNWKIVSRVAYPLTMLFLIYYLIFLGFKLIKSRDQILERSERANKQKLAITKITIGNEFNTLGLIQTFNKLNQLVAGTLSVDIVSIWLLNDDQRSLKCASLYHAESKTFRNGYEIDLNKYPEYFDYLTSQNLIAIEDITQERILSDFYQLYMKDSGVKSIMNACILLDGKLKGIVALEIVREKRRWYSDEEAFVSTISAIIGQFIARDKRHQAENDLLEANQRFLTTLESMADGFIYFDKHLVYKYINQRAFEMFNLNPELLKDEDIWDILPEKFTKLLEKLIKETTQTKKPLFHSEFFVDLDKWLEIRIFPAEKDVSVFFVDITNKKQAEKALVENQRLTAIGEMASAFSHDFNNYLQIILANIQVLENKVYDPEETKDYLKTILLATTDAATRVQLLQRFAGTKNSVSDYERINLNSVTKEAIMQAKPLWKTETERKGISIIINETFANLPDIFGNQSELRSVLYNLIKNAVEAMPKGGKINFETGSYEAGVFLRVSDTGEGMSEEIIERIFEPFFTTKGYDAGKGLGLSGSYNIINEHKGSIKVFATKPGSGTTMEIILPYHVFPEEEIKTDSRVNKNPEILWVDDDALIRHIANDMLSIIGYTVTLVESGEEALEILKNKDFDIMLTDIGMPGMSGWQLVDIVNEQYRGKMKIALISGWGDQITEQQKNEHQVDFVLSKPIKISQLKNLLEKALNNEE